MCKPYLAYSASESAPVNPPFCEDGGRSGTRQFDPNRGETSESKGRRPPFKLVKVRSVPIKLGDACNLSRRLTPARARYLARLKAKRPINNSAWDFNADSGSAPPPRLESTKAWPWRWRRTKVLSNTVHHLMTNVLPAARDYEQAEDELSHAFARDADPKTWQQEGQQAKRRAAEVAIAIDGLADRAAAALGLTPEDVRKQVARRCVIGGATRPGSIERVCAVANAYKHPGPLHTRHPITSESDVLATGAGYGIDAFGVGKFSGGEVLVNQKDGCAKIPCRRSFGNGG